MNFAHNSSPRLPKAPSLPALLSGESFQISGVLALFAGFMFLLAFGVDRDIVSEAVQDVTAFMSGTYALYSIVVAAIFLAIAAVGFYARVLRDREG